MYSKVAHVIESFGCKHPLFKAKTINVLKKRYNSAKQTFEKTCNKSDEEIEELVMAYKLLRPQTHDEQYNLRELPRCDTSPMYKD
ncbi:hypothetical protein E3Q11_03937 [Wallemia mellicola]|uniref:Uncharacterized protein n=1 Tax=Wallemia mellicola TaxID=1708541 RepID=A0A4T0QH21_9BASI|nr:hypothetical protein E3Q11_03937 [Wallemia mellicola]TIC62965.1 hypothetical protein E3Q01_03642 [Wallemia mellicola]